MDKKIKIASLISGSGTNLQAILDACDNGKINGEVVVVGSDNKDAKGLERAKKKNIPTFIVDYSSTIKKIRENPYNIDYPYDFDLKDILSKQSILKNESEDKIKFFLISRAIVEFEIIRAIKPFSIDLLVLAGFMRNLTPYFIDRINTEPDKPRIMNIHPAVLPSFPGTDGYGDTFRYGCKIGGCTVHFVDYGEDSGAIIGQKAFIIDENDTIETIKEKGLKLEWELYPKCIELFARERLEIVKRHCRSIVKIL